MRHAFAARGWGQAKTANAKRGNLAVGISLGSGYQGIFTRALTDQQRQDEIAKMKAAGITWVRMDAEWRTVQPTQTGAFDFSFPDVTANAMLAAGMNLVILLNYSPAWAARAANTAPLYSPWPTPDPALYAAYCSATVAHYAAMGVHVFELWNEPNLDVGATTVAGWGHLSPRGVAELAVAAYPAIKAADPKAFVLSPSLATSTEFGTAGTAKTASWSAVSAGATTATVSCATAASTDAYGILTDTADGWPLGTVITAATAGVGYTVAPPVWSTGFPAIAAGTSRPVQVSNVQYPPDLFLDKMYGAAAGRPMFDALAIHPYTQPVLPASHQAIYGGWAVVPTMRSLMIAAGDGAKPMWMTEVGAPTGAGTASWSAAASSATTLTVTCSTAAAADLGYKLAATGLPTGTYIGAVTAGTSWTAYPPTGITLATALTAGTATTSLTVAATPTALTIPSGMTLTVVVPTTSIGSTVVLSVTTSGSVTTSTSGTTTIPISSVTPTYSYPVGSLVRGSVGQTWGIAISAASAVAATVVAPGVATVPSMVTEATQSAIIAQVFQSVTSGVPGGSGTPGSVAWPYVGPIFIYAWNDGGGGAGPFGLTRVDGTLKPALAAVTTAVSTGV